MGSDLATTCRWCESSEVQILAYCAKARWIVDDPTKSEANRLVICPGCDLMYFEQSFTESELGNMYNGYRGDDYFSRRNKYEPWYTKRVNDAIGHSSKVLELRQQHLQDFLKTTILENHYRPHREFLM